MIDMIVMESVDFSFYYGSNKITTIYKIIIITAALGNIDILILNKGIKR